MRGLAKNIKCINKLTRVVPVTTLIHCFKHMLCPSHFRNTLPGDPVANAERAMATVIAQLKGLPVTAVARRITGQPSAGPGGTVHQDAHPPGKGHKRGRGGTVTSSTRRMEVEAATGPGSKKATPKRPFKPKTHKQFALKVTEPQLSTPSLPPKVIGVDGKEETVEQVKPAGLSRPAFPPKDAGETFCNSFMCDTLR